MFLTNVFVSVLFQIFFKEATVEVKRPLKRTFEYEQLRPENFVTKFFSVYFFLVS